MIESYRGMVYPWHCDHHGHLNTMHYVGMFDAAFYHHAAALGFGRAYLNQANVGWVDVKDTIEYKAELGPGDLVVIESGLLKVGRSSMTACHVMKNADTGEICATSEKISVLFDLAQRAAAPIPDDKRAAMQAHIVEREG